MNLDRLFYLLLTFILIAFAYFALAFEVKPITRETQSQDVNRDGLAGLTCGEPEHDFGRVQSDGQSVHLFQVSNQSNYSVEILTVNSSCGCLVTRSQLTGQTVEKGGSVGIPVMLDWRGKNGPFQGVVDVKFRALDKDLDSRLGNKAIQFVVRGDVLPLLSCNTDSIDFGRIEKAKSQKVVVSRIDGLSMKDLVVETTNEVVTAKVLRSDDNHCEIEVSVVVDPASNRTRLNASLNLELPDIKGNGRLLFIPIRGEYLKSNLTFFPTRFVFNPKRTQQRLIIQIGTTIDKPVELSVSESLKGKLQIEPQESSGNGERHYELNLIADQTSLSGGRGFEKGEIIVSNGTDRVGIPVMIVEK